MMFALALLALAAVLALVGWSGRRRKGWTFICINVAAVICALALFDIYLGHRQAEGDGTRMEGSVVDGFTHRDDLLGYAPFPNARVTAKKLYGDSVIYDVVYTTDRHGLRITAPPAADARECLVFFGDSITFGEGVQDTEDFPYLVSKRLAGRFATYNFAFSGYGPHQMLAILQSGRIAKIADCTPRHFFYLCIPDHAARVAGLYDWDQHGPRFVLRPDGTVEQRGHFDDPRPILGLPGTSWIRDLLHGSAIWQRFFGSGRGIVPADVSLLVAVIGQSARIAQKRFPGSTFEVIMWDGGDKEKVQAIERGLKADGVRERRMTDIVPDFYTQSDKYVLSPHDLHPNPTFHRMMADFISAEILGRQQ
jgi:hypothetical protein